MSPQAGPLPLWEEDKEYGSALQSALGFTIIDPVRLYMLWQFSRDASERVPGDVAEVGVYRGGSARIFQKAILKKNIKIHLFDTFKGIPSADPKRDLHRAGNFSDVDFEALKKAFETDPRIQIHQGIFPDTAKGIEGPFSFVHIDVDTYSSTLACMKYFSTRMSPGGVIIDDDYGYLSCPGARQAVDEFLSPKKAIYLPTGQALRIY